MGQWVRGAGGNSCVAATWDIPSLCPKQGRLPHLHSFVCPRRAFDEVVCVDHCRNVGAFFPCEGTLARLLQFGDGLQVVPQVGIHANEQKGYVGAEVPCFWDLLRGGDGGDAGQRDGDERAVTSTRSQPPARPRPLMPRPSALRCDHALRSAQLAPAHRCPPPAPCPIDAGAVSRGIAHLLCHVLERVGGVNSVADENDVGVRTGEGTETIVILHAGCAPERKL